MVQWCLFSKSVKRPYLLKIKDVLSSMFHFFRLVQVMTGHGCVCRPCSVSGGGRHIVPLNLTYLPNLHWPPWAAAGLLAVFGENLSLIGRSIFDSFEDSTNVSSYGSPHSSKAPVMCEFQASTVRHLIHNYNFDTGTTIIGFL